MMSRSTNEPPTWLMLAAVVLFGLLMLVFWRGIVLAVHHCM